MGIAANWSRENLAWAGGLFEGEGCITITMGRVVLELQMTDEDVVRRLHSVLGVGVVNGPYQGRPQDKPYWRWSLIGGRRGQAVIAALWPFLGVRRKARAVEAIKFFAAQPIYVGDRKACPKGHVYESSNLYKSKRGYRICRACNLEQSRAYKKKKNNGSNKLHNSTSCAEVGAA